ncbi:hypothetical protein [uncultured Thiohalocapsa sp.]|uniref:hypothetical protein n=1 Tax=uncultured Thiohalocapsa sp. TaxID=768990 RepID=UPI0025F5A570|nr:hypothetical protein [uncultured Thiohalocapsa sp.]
MAQASDTAQRRQAQRGLNRSGPIPRRPTTSLGGPLLLLALLLLLAPLFRGGNTLLASLLLQYLALAVLVASL